LDNPLQRKFHEKNFLMPDSQSLEFFLVNL
jgi:hypothetical protein